MAILNLDEFAPKEEPVATPPQAQAPSGLNLDDMPLEEQPQVVAPQQQAQPTGMLDLTDAPMLATPEGDKPPAAVKSQNLLEFIVEPYLRFNRQVAGGMSDVVRGTLRGSAAALETAGLAQEKTRQQLGIPWKPLVDVDSHVISGLLKVDKWLEGKGFYPGLEPDQSYLDSLARGLGQAPVYMLGGYAGAMAKLPTWLIPSGLGAITGAGFADIDAEEHNATPEQQALAAVGGALGGATEGIPYGYFLNRMNKATGGKLWDAMQTTFGESLDTVIKNTLGGAAPPNILWEGVKSAIAEASQEGLQNQIENVFAREVAGYDPERSQGESFWDSVLVGAGVGGLIGAGTGAYSRKQYKEERARKEEEWTMLRTAYPEINSIEGMFTPLGVLQGKRVYDLLQSSSNLQALTEALNTKADAAFTEFMDSGTLPNIDPQSLVSVSQDRQRLDYQYNLASSYQGLLDSPVDPLLQAEENNRTVQDVVTNTDKQIVFAPMDWKAGEVQLKLSELKRNRSDLAKLQLALQSETDTTQQGLLQDAMKRQKLLLKETARDYGRLARAVKAAESFTRNTSTLVEQLQKVFKLPNAKFIIAPSENPSSKNWASMGTMKGLMDSAGNPLDVKLLKLNFNNLLSRLFPTDGSKALTKTERNTEWLRTAEILVHEFGHAYQTTEIAKLHKAYLKLKGVWDNGATDATGVFERGKWLSSETVEKALGKETLDQAKTYLALIGDYTGFVNDSAKRLTYPEHFAAARGLALGAKVGDTGSIANVKDLNYWLSFDEYIAHRFERLYASAQVNDQGNRVYVSQDLDLLLEKNFFKKYHKAYKDALKELVNAPGMEKGWLDKIAHNDQAMDLAIRKVVLPEEIRRIIDLVQEGGGKNLVDAIKGKVPGLDARGWVGLAAEYDRFTKMNYLFKNLIQIARDHPHIQGLQQYFQAVAEKWSPYSRNVYSRATETIKAWRALAKESSNRLTNVLMEETEQKQPLAPTELAQRLNDEEAQVYHMIRQDLAHMLNEMQRVHEQNLKRTMYDNQEMLNEQLKESQEVFNSMRHTGYFPFMRFGKYLLTVRSNEDQVIQGTAYKAGQLVSWEAFDSMVERVAAERAWKSEKANVVLQKQLRTDTDYSVQGLPLPFLKSLKDTLVASNASAQVLKEIDETIKNSLPLTSFKRQFLKRRGIKGYSQDFMRSYASYMRMGANHISRIEHSPEMMSAIKRVQDDLALATYVPQASLDMRARLADWMQEHYQYIMNPQNELQALRAAGFFFHLGFNVKSAALNLFQIPMVGLPYLGGKYGDVQAVAALAKAQVQIADYWKNRDDWIKSSLSNEKRKLSYAMLAANLDQEVGLYALHGMSDQFDFDKQNGKFYDLSQMKLINLNEVGKTKELIETRLRLEKRELIENKQLVEKLTLALQEQLAVSSPIDFQQFTDLDLGKALVELGMEGAVLLENSVDEDGTTVLVTKNKSKLKEVSAEKAKALGQSNDTSRKGDIVRMLEHLKNIGVTDQSLAMELAIAASENRSDRLAPLNAAERIWYSASEYGALPFHVAEKLNRNVMAIAAYNLSRDNGFGHTRAVEEAKAAVRDTMYEYASWNRPVALRGKRSALFLFMNYVMNTADLATQGNKTALRMWLMFAAMAGLTGLPFADDVEDLINFTVTKLNKWLGIKGPKFILRQEMREMLNQMELNPDLILHGFGQQSFGLLGLSELTGLPMPGIDLSGSLGLGNIIPGTGIPGAMTKGADQTLREVVREGGGALGTTFESMLGSALSDNPNDWKQAEAFVPTFMKNAMQAYRMGKDQGVFTSGGQQVAAFDPHDPRDQLTLTFKALGFQPTKVSRGWERVTAEKEYVEYYRMMQAQLMRDINAARWAKDREGTADAMKALKEYNKIVPYPELKVNDDTLMQSFERYYEQRKQAGSRVGLTSGEKNLRMQKEIRGGYETPKGEGSLDTP
jgi:hypothetical protein